MQLAPRYDASPIIVLDGPPSAVLAPAVRQWRRLAATVAAFDDEQWAHPSRCAGWTNRDVIVHLESAGSFWVFSVLQGLRGEPTRFLATFDPVASPAEMVAASTASTTEVVERFSATTEAFTSLLEELDDTGWAATVESPPGHVAVSTMVHHALWDSWVHERDVLVPMGAEVPVEADEVRACLRYAAALSPAFAVNNGAVGVGRLVVEAEDPRVRAVVEVGADVVVTSEATPAHADLVLGGGAVDLLEALSVRRPLDVAVPAHAAWMVSGLAEVFAV